MDEMNQKMQRLFDIMTKANGAKDGDHADGGQPEVLLTTAESAYLRMLLGAAATEAVAGLLEDPEPCVREMAENALVRTLGHERWSTGS